MMHNILLLYFVDTLLYNLQYTLFKDSENER